MGAKVATFEQCYNAEKRRRLLYSPEGAMEYRQGQRPCIAQHSNKP